MVLSINWLWKAHEASSGLLRSPYTRFSWRALSTPLGSSFEVDDYDGPVEELIGTDATPGSQMIEEVVFVKTPHWIQDWQIFQHNQHKFYKALSETASNLQLVGLAWSYDLGIWVRWWPWRTAIVSFKDDPKFIEHLCSKHFFHRWYGLVVLPFALNFARTPRWGITALVLLLAYHVITVSILLRIGT